MPTITPHLVRSIAVEASADPRTVRRVLEGERAKGMVDDRIRAVLAQRGIRPPNETSKAA
jgi:hypothetical protein